MTEKLFTGTLNHNKNKQKKTTEGTDTLIFAFTSKTGQSVARYTHRIFLFEFFSQREDIFTHFIGLISSSRHKGFARKN